MGAIKGLISGVVALSALDLVVSSPTLTGKSGVIASSGSTVAAIYNRLVDPGTPLIGSLDPPTQTTTAGPAPGKLAADVTTGGSTSGLTASPTLLQPSSDPT